VFDPREKTGCAVKLPGRSALCMLGDVGLERGSFLWHRVIPFRFWSAGPDEAIRHDCQPNMHRRLTRHMNDLLCTNLDSGRVVADPDRTQLFGPISDWPVIRPVAWSWIEMPAISGRPTTRLRFTRLLNRRSLLNWTRHRCVPGSLQKARMQSEAHGITDMKGLVGAPRNIHVV
jgi:hypothetical protein